MSDRPLVSVVIPTYNQKEKFLRECIESARAQTYPHIRIIISDNHSTNNVAAILEEYQAADDRIQIVKPPRFLNITESFLFALTQTQGKYACYVSSDDILMPSCIEELMAGMLADPATIFAHGKALYFFPDGKTDLRWEYFNSIPGHYSFNREAAERLLKFEYVCFGGCLLDIDAWHSVIERYKNLQLNINYSLDIMLTLLLFEKGKLYYSDKILAQIRVENDTRDSRLPFTIEDAASIWNFVENDKKMNAMLHATGIDIKAYRRRFFLLQSKALYFPFFESHFDFDSLKTGFKNLKKFDIKAPFYFTALEKFLLNFPGASKAMYKLAKPLLVKIFKK